MPFSKKYAELRAQFDPCAERTDFAGSGISCHSFLFGSTYPADALKGSKTQVVVDNALFAVPDEAIAENQAFRYYIFTPGRQKKYPAAILLLHGLNERSWDKYLVWAYYLAENTGKPVILFPIAFHMNRSPEAWGNPRIMQPLHKLRVQKYGDDPSATFANVALSERLTEDPLRFFTSGQQSAADLVKLLGQMSRGEHPLFEQAATFNVFAYSIGAFLAQILFIANPEGLFSKAKLFLFCGGAFFEEMNGVSKLIMDKLAFERLLNFYIHDINLADDSSGPIANVMHKTTLGQAFLSMLAPGLMQPLRESRFRQMGTEGQVIALKNDQVIPALKIAEALEAYMAVEILDFPYVYSHEAPFPVSNSSLFAQVDAAFEQVFSKAARFLG